MSHPGRGCLPGSFHSSPREAAASPLVSVLPWDQRFQTGGKDHRGAEVRGHVRHQRQARGPVEASGGSQSHQPLWQPPREVMERAEGGPMWAGPVSGGIRSLEPG